MNEIKVNPSTAANIRLCPRMAVGNANLHALKGRFILNAPSTTVAAIAGTMLHAAVPMPPDDRAKWLTAADGFVSDFDREYDRATQDDGIFEWDKATPDIEALQRQVAGMAEAIDKATAGDFWLKSADYLTENFLEAQVQDGIGDETGRVVNMRGRFDFFHRPTKMIIDIKTGKQKHGKDNGAQLAAYHVLLKKHGYEVNPRARIIYVRRHAYTSRTPLQEPAVIYEYDLAPYLNQLKMQISEAVTHTLHFYGDDELADPNRLPANPSCFLCSVDYCRFHGTSACDITQKGVREIINQNPTEDQSHD